MNLRLVAKLLGIICLLIGCAMLFSIPWASPPWGVRNAEDIVLTGKFETRGFIGLLLSFVVCCAIGGAFWWYGRKAEGELFRKEAMAVVGLSWVMATVLGALPYQLSGCQRGPVVRMNNKSGQIAILQTGFLGIGNWQFVDAIDQAEMIALQRLLEAGGQGVGLKADASREERQQYEQTLSSLRKLSERNDLWNKVLDLPKVAGGVAKVRFATMSLVDCWFESQSGFSTTGATVISDLESPELVPHCILFWRSSTHFLGGLGIIVLFVAILGQGSAGKALMLAELPGPSQDSGPARIQQAAWTSQPSTSF